ncbi:uncharacterized protein LOC141602378 [Silene latifolia]|uniref:uncharacterized protein LOC141602378 n=1 Tax=Silene latifolia TaxID=37657 RepID=UPI003D789E95
MRTRVRIRSLEEKTKEKHSLSGRKVLKQRVRVMYTDPDATDCSGDEKDSRFCFVRKDVNGVKRMVGEVCISSGCGGDGNRGSSASTSTRNKTIMRVKPKTDDLTKSVPLLKRSSSKYKGVRKRKWGKYASEIRNPFLGKKREWLGTYATELEAHLAYEKKKREIDALLNLDKRNTTSTVAKSAVAKSAVVKSAVAKSAVAKSAVVKSAVAKSAVCALAAATVPPDVHRPAIHQRSTSAVATSEDEHVNSMGNLPSPSSVLHVSDAKPVGNAPTVVIKVEDNQYPDVNRHTGSVSSSFFGGTDFNYLFDEIKIEDLPMCDLSGIGLCDLPNFDLDITNADLNFIDDLLDMTGI